LTIACAPRLVLTALPGIPIVRQGDDLTAHILAGLRAAEIDLEAGDVLVVTSKLLSRAEGRWLDLRSVEPSPRAIEMAAIMKRDPRFIEAVLRESEAVSRIAPNVLVTRHRLGMTIANAGIDRSNVDPSLPGEEVVLLLPSDPDASASRIRDGVESATGAAVAVVITDSHGRPFRQGTVGAAIGVAGMPALWDQRGRRDLFGRTLEMTITALADQVAAAADLVAGQAAESRPVVHVRGLSFPAGAGGSAADLLRPRDQDLYFEPR
jgi:coenzyme F420-0:L-glutamate ligase / coenzyme F420-1:gamma-L-glutamate ligase